MTTKESLLAILSPVHQEHLLQYWDTLPEASREKLASQIRQVNWEQLENYVKSASQGISQEELQQLIPMPYKPAVPAPGDEELYAQAIQRGEEMLRNGEVGIFTVAGGQGSRLGYNGPKGTFRVSALQHKSLFQLFAEKILYAQKKYNVKLRWYLMTSVINDQATRDFFTENNYFGLEANQVMFFPQGMLPALDLKTGKALMAAPDAIALTPNGHGGSFAALKDSGALRDMAAHGIKTITYFQVDNALIRPFDLLFLGLHDLLHSDMSSRALLKRDAMEKLGHFCLLNGKAIIIEYSDMPMELLQKQDPDGRLSFRAGSPAIHILSRDFVERLTAGDLRLAAHRAVKKVPYLNANGDLVAPTEPNALKLEFFLFDALPMAHSPLVLEGDRALEFAPVKNAEGNDSPDSCRAAMLARAVHLFEAAGIPFPRKADGSPDAVVEISERTIQTPAELKAANPPAITPGMALYLE